MFVKKFLLKFHSNSYYIDFYLKDDKIEVTLGTKEKLLCDVNSDNLNKYKAFILYEKVQYEFYVSKFSKKAYKSRLMMLIALILLIISTVISCFYVHPYILIIGIISGFSGLFLIKRARRFDKMVKKINNDEVIQGIFEFLKVMPIEVKKIENYINSLK